jgi:hypothetical protein
MSAAPISAWSFIGATIAALLGVGFFFVIIGVFGLSAAFAALILFVALAIPIFRRHQAGETRL